MVFLGYGGHFHVVSSTLEIEPNGVFDDNENLSALYLGRYDENVFPNDDIVITIGDNTIRKVVSFGVRHRFGILKSIHSIIDSSVILDDGSVILHGAIIQAKTKIGKHVIINTGASVDHDCIIEDFVHISPHATLCGNVFVGEGTHFGAAAVAIPGIKIGKWCTIGAGAVIIEDIPDYAVVVGNPGKIIKYNTVLE